MTDDEAKVLHDAIVDLEEFASHCLPATRSFLIVLSTLHAAMHLGEAGLATLVTHTNQWVHGPARTLAAAQLRDAERRAMGERSENPGPAMDPKGVYDHFADVERLAEQLRNGNFPSNPNPHNPQ